MRRTLLAAAAAVCAVASATATAAAAAATGSGWSVVVTPNPAGARASGLAAVACSATGACTAVGQSQRGARVVPLAERWNGTAFSIQSTPSPASSPAFSALNGVSCPGAHACTAVGSIATSALSGFTLAERWNGTTWSIQRTANRPGAQLLGVSCLTATACTAVGSYQKNAEQSLVLAERWNGATWSLQPIPSPPGSVTSSLAAVSCSATSACTAVGTFTSHGEDLPLAERWNGSTWSIQPVPAPTSEGGDLAGVTCTAASACTAVGEFIDQADAHSFALAERWNGSTWSIQKPPTPPGGVNAFLSGISCPASTACTAVGHYVNIRANNEVTLAERWDGTAWSVQSTPSPGSGPDALAAVACPATTSCVAAGVQFQPHGKFLPLGERFAA
jgi:hypothetical protein